MLKWIIAKKERKKAQGEDLEAFLMHTTFHFHLVQHGVFIVRGGTGVFECFMTLGRSRGFKKIPTRTEFMHWVKKRSPYTHRVHALIIQCLLT